LAKELSEITQNLITSLAINTIAIPPLPIPDQQIWEVTCILNGAQASKRLIEKFTKFENDIQNLSQKCIRGSAKHVTKKILKATQENVAEKEVRIINPQNDKAEREFWSSVAMAACLNDCRYILKL
jgi:hypothetical protein